MVSGKKGLNDTAKALAKIANDNAAAWMGQTLDVIGGSDAVIGAGLAALQASLPRRSSEFPLLAPECFH